MTSGEVLVGGTIYGLGVFPYSGMCLALVGNNNASVNAPGIPYQCPALLDRAWSVEHNITIGLLMNNVATLCGY
jgi:hypothetical protein